MSTKKAVMPYEHYKGACDVIRSHNPNDTELICSDVLSGHIESACDFQYDKGFDDGYAYGLANGGGSEDLSPVLTEQETLITELKALLETKASGGSGDNGDNLAVKILNKTITEITSKDLEGVTVIDYYAFRYCENLTKVEFHEGLTSIGINAFVACSSLKTVIMPNSLAYINQNAFKSCTAMQEYDFSKCTSVPSLLNISAFGEIPSTCVMKIPAALIDEWKAATNWSEYASYMVAV